MNSKAILLSTTGIAASLAMLAFGFVSGQPRVAAPDTQIVTASTNGQLDRGDVENIVREYLLANPEILLDVQQALEDKRDEQQRLAHRQVIEQDKAEIFNSAYDGIVGNPDGKYTIVEFYDYNCGYCKRAQQDMLALTAENPDLRFVLKEFPILGPDSQKAHVVSMAFRALMPEKYGEFHNQLLGGQGRADEASAIKIALSLGADEAKLREEMKNPAIIEAFSRTYDLANKLAISGTPSYVIGDEVVFGALGKEALQEKIAAATK
ncbi:protein-disulfide isomerase [Pseudaminobacter salicylatoxidans]|uniref:Protein-disulfide isomerase n=1 Tax=Pseudaminobacter salicylatoxidans TaxID=93369 RepID=A0A316BYQ0_PSESE|nr:DsbA family protein [Pseudaminobacter salicylatoxidans]PWJ79492.1 protein-disulfide isomerase [Pseudaminobacter salicylatoxidans]